jgi:hypothetical protein
MVAEVSPMHADATCSIVRSRNLLVVAWRQTPEVGHLRLVDRRLDEMHARHAGRFGFVNILISFRPELFTKDRLDMVHKMTSDKPPVPTAHVILLAGISGTIARTILRAVPLVTMKAKIPWCTFGDVSSAATWIASNVVREDGVWSQGEVGDLMRDSIDPPPSSRTRPTVSAQVDAALAGRAAPPSVTQDQAPPARASRASIPPRSRS